jgi:hypothetical protein
MLACGLASTSRAPAFAAAISCPNGGEWATATSIGSHDRSPPHVMVKSTVIFIGSFSAVDGFVVGDLKIGHGGVYMDLVHRYLHQCYICYRVMFDTVDKEKLDAL